jgi:hypothetical protein
MSTVNENKREFMIFKNGCLRVSQILSILMEEDENDDCWYIKIVLLTGEKTKTYGCKDFYETLISLENMQNQLY